MDLDGARHQLECDVYGFPYIYDAYRDSVLPVSHEGKEGILQTGSSFIAAADTLVTAAHCVEGAERIAVRGVSIAELQNCRIWRFENKSMDVAILHFDQPIFPSLKPIKSAEPQILQSVMALGYPDVPGFHQTLAAERALISSRFTAVTGAVAAITKDIWTPTDLLLVTARVRGGFSGGPLVNERGQCVGLVTREPAMDGAAHEAAHKYDNLGYGVAVPSSAIDELISDVRCKSPKVATEVKGMAFSNYI